MDDFTRLIINTIAIYGICFGFQHKATFIHNKNEFLDKMFKCTYCTGFHCGWIVYILFFILNENEFKLNILFETILFGFYGASMCYIIDTIIRYFESNIVQYENIEQEFEEE